ncbi:hypothetical protein CDCA_CDCA08G2287 [Cyanidium caldarium]|uniref:Uncharacterized protein n=1 Tax=Cyanidium caldarium TaxID=2771 RepID=A0AAV9IV97_CYACA|nr:hypothetical protein CDCA_CDCA08G2287 [Cyanidium caldarium]
MSRAAVQRAAQQVRQAVPVPDCIVPGPHPALSTLHAARRTGMEKRDLRQLRRDKHVIPAVLQRYQQPDWYLVAPVAPLRRDVHHSRRFVWGGAPNSLLSGPLYNLAVHASMAEAEEAAAQEAPGDKAVWFHAVARQLQLHPVSEEPLHVGFYAYDRTGVIHPNGVRLRVPLRAVGMEKNEALRFGYINQLAWSVEILVAHDVVPPTHLEADVSALAIHRSCYGRDIACPPGVRLPPGGDAQQLIKICRDRRAHEL